MSWENELKKAKFQGPERKYAKFQADEMYLGMAIRAIHSHVKDAMESLDGDLNRTRGSLKLAMEEIDKIDEEMLERAKYVGRKKQTYEFDERIDEDDLEYRGGKYPRDR
jgi:hypothetical protein